MQIRFPAGEKSGNALFIFLMTEQTETTEIKMNMRNINVITALSVPGKTVSDDFSDHAGVLYWRHKNRTSCTGEIRF